MDSKDALGDIGLDFTIDNAIASIVTKGVNGAAVKQGEYYGYYEHINKFACSICVSTLDGDEESAKQHVNKCIQMPKEAADAGKLFCPICWRMISQDNLTSHFLSVGHKQTVDRMEANENRAISVWLMKNGPTFVEPKEATCPMLKYGLYHGNERLAMARAVFSGYSAEKKIREQIINALRAASGNFGTATAKLSTTSPLVVGLRNIVNCASIGAIPCDDHALDDEYRPQIIIKALAEIFPSNVMQALEATHSAHCRLCGKPIAVFRNPKNVAKAINHVIAAIVGEQKKDVEMEITSEKKKSRKN